MALESPLMLCALAIGAAQVLDCCLLRSGKLHTATVTAFSIIEWIWGAFCVYLLITKRDGFPPWLAGVFVAQLAAWLLYVLVQTQRGRAVETFELSRTEALAGGLFGAFYAAAALVAWVGASTDFRLG